MILSMSLPPPPSPHSSIQLFAGMLHSTKVQEKNKTRIRLQDIGFSGLTLLMEHAAVSMSVARTLVELVTGQTILFSYNVKPALVTAL